MRRFRLRYQSTDLEMPTGEFVIGRSSECNLALDDSLVSRRHAAMSVTGDGVTVRDLGSRNGVIVNGERIEEPRPLKHLDRVTIGGQLMVLIEQEQVKRSTRATTDMIRCPACGTFAESSARSCPACEAPLSMGNATVEIKLDDRNATLTPGSQNTLRLISGIAKKALQLERYTEASRILRPHLLKLLNELRASDSSEAADVDVGLMRDATSFALSLADGLGDEEWIDWVLEAHFHAALLLSAEDIEKLHTLVRRLRYKNTRLVGDYVVAMRGLESGFSAAQRFQLKRLEGLERVISA